MWRRSLAVVVLALALAFAPASSPWLAVRAGDVGILSTGGPSTVVRSGTATVTVQPLQLDTVAVDLRLSITSPGDVTITSATPMYGFTCIGGGRAWSCVAAGVKRWKFLAGSESVAVGELRYPSVANSHVYRCTTAGTTSGGEPSWPTGAGATVTDGSVVWTESGTDHFSFAVAISPTVAYWRWVQVLFSVSYITNVATSPDLNSENDARSWLALVNG